MLKTIGVEAYPCLINTNLQEALVKELPSPGHFDHVTLVLYYGGKTIWIDPTISEQGGSLFTIPYPLYGYALRVKPGETQLDNATQR